MVCPIISGKIVERLDRKQQWTLGTLTQPDGTVVVENEPKEGDLAIDSVRRDEVPGIHSIRWDSDADQITLTHFAHSRRGFALGAVLAAEYTARHSGLLTMDDLFNF